MESLVTTHDITEHTIPQIEVPTHIYRANDIRGVVGKDLTPELFYLIGLGFGSQMRYQHLNRCVVGRDGRLSGPQLKSALIKGLKATGVEVIDIDLVPSPVLYFATHFFKTGTGIVITGSHNPADYNGLKMMMGGKTLSQDNILSLRDRINDKDFVFGQGHSIQKSVIQDYVQTIASQIKLQKSLKVVIDCGHGAASVVAEQVYQALGADVIPLYSEVDGHFPVHHPDPSKEENLTDLIEKVKQTKADIGLAFDGDGDRLGVVTSEGDIIKPDRQLMLYAEQILEQFPQSPIIFDVKCSQHLTRWIEQKGGTPVMHKTGHAFIKSKMLNMNAPLAGEMSGHFFFGKPWYGFDDGVYAGARLLEILSQRDETPTQVFNALPDSVNTPELQIPIDDDKKFKFIDTIKATNAFDGAEIITIDGLRVEYQDGWGLVRASNTSPCLVLRFEADTSEALERIKTHFRQVISQANGSLAIPF